MMKERYDRTNTGRMQAGFATFYLPLILLISMLSPIFGGAREAARVKDPGDRTFVSLGPAITEKLYLLGVQDRLVGVTTYCARPRAAYMKEKVGTVTEADTERIFNLRPDLVLATSLTQTRVIKRLRGLGMTVTVFDEPASFGEMNRQFIELGKLVGKEPTARTLVRKAEEKVRRIRDRVKGRDRPKVFIQIGSKPLFTATRRSFVSDMVELAGASNIAADARVGLYSREQVLAHNPDVILIILMGMAPEKEKTVWQRFPAISAVRNNRIAMIDPYLTCSPTPETFVKALETIAEILHPGLRETEQ